MGQQGPARLNLTLMLYPYALRDWQGLIDVYMQGEFITDSACAVVAACLLSLSRDWM